MKEKQFKKNTESKKKKTAKLRLWFFPSIERSIMAESLAEARKIAGLA